MALTELEQQLLEAYKRQHQDFLRASEALQTMFDRSLSENEALLQQVESLREQIESLQKQVSSLQKQVESLR